MGSATLEFALIVPAVVALILACIETALVFFVQQMIETSVEATARTVITGQAQASDQAGGANGMTQAQLQARFRQNACATLPKFLSCSNMFVDVRSSTDWKSLDTSPEQLTFDKNGNVTNQFGYSLGNSGSIVLVRLMYLWPVQAGPLGFDLSTTGTGKRLIIATSVAKIENYSA